MSVMTIRRIGGHNPIYILYLTKGKGMKVEIQWSSIVNFFVTDNETCSYPTLVIIMTR